MGCPSHTHRTTSCQRWRTTWAGYSSGPSASTTWRPPPSHRRHCSRPSAPASSS
uniref:Uncharacterized protein n=1 Tax=Arundo donax TaxID=35708 RepID=A0A0A9GUM6_ARUDO